MLKYIILAIIVRFLSAAMKNCENQLADLEKKIDGLTENKTTLPGEFLSISYVRLTTHLC